MGMYDTIIVPAGLPSKEGTILRTFQTKDLDQGMGTYYIHEGFLFTTDSGRGAEAERDLDPIEEMQFSLDQHPDLTRPRLKVVPATRLYRVKVEYCGNLSLYTSDEEHVVHTRCQGIMGPRKNDHHPWVEYVAKIMDGRVLNLEMASESESLEDLRRKLAEQGSLLIEPTDPRFEKLCGGL